MKFSQLINKEYKKNDVSIIWLILIPFAVILLCFTLLTNYMLLFSNDKLRNEMYISHDSTFNALSTNIQSLKYGLDSFALQTSNNKLLHSIGEKYEWNDSDVYYDILNLNTDLDRALLPFASIKSISIYYPRTDNIVINGGIIPANREYKNYLISNHISPEKSFSEWKTFMISPHSFEMYRSENGDIFYLQSVMKSGDTIAVIILDINQDIFSKLLIGKVSDSGMIIYNHLNEVILFNGSKSTENPFEENIPDYNKKAETLKIKDKSYIRFMDKKSTQIRFSYYIAESEVYQSAMDMTKKFYLLVILVIILTVIVALYFTKFHYKSIADIKETLRKFSSTSQQAKETKNEYKYIKDSVLTLSEKLIQNEFIINKQNNTKFLLSLKRNLINNYESMKIRDLMNIHYINFSFSNYVAVLATIKYVDEDSWFLPSGDSELIFVAIDNLFKDYSGDFYNNILVQINEDTALIIIGTEKKQKDTISKDIEKLFVEENAFCKEKLNFDFYVNVSDVFSDIDDIKTIYKKLYYSHYTNPENVVTFQNNLPFSSNYDHGFLGTIEVNLEKHLEECNFQATKELLEELFTEKLKDVPNSILVYVNIRILSVFSSLVKNLEQDKLEEYMRILNHNPKTNLLKSFITLADYYCSVTAIKYRSNVSLSTAVAEYVNSHFCDPRMNVNTLSYEFGKTPSYISSLFKAETGKMLNQYISETRLHQAKILLISGEKVDDIYKKCGFSDITTFRRAFKRYVGLTPSEYRKNHNAEKE